MSQYISVEEAVTRIKSGMTLMIGGFLANGSATKIIEAMAQSDVKDLTVIANDTAYPDKGVGLLLGAGKIKKLIVSYIGATPLASELMNKGELEVELVPQGTLAERIRCGAYGLGGVLVPTGLDTLVAEGKQEITVDGKRYLLELPLRADVALIGASKSDTAGNLWYGGTSRNFNPMMAGAADTVIAEVKERVDKPIKAEDVHTPGMLIDYIV